MSIKIESFTTVFVGALIIWYLARRTNLGASFIADIQRIPQNIGDYIGGAFENSCRPPQNYFRG